MSSHFLHKLINPKSVAIYGASNTYEKFGTMMLFRILTSGFDNTRVYPIHLRLDTVLGCKAYKKIADVPEIPDLVILVIPSRFIIQTFKECAEKGVKHLIIVSGGFREMDDERKNTYTEELVEIAKKYGIRFIGPNCLGMYNAWLDPSGQKSFNMMLSDPVKRGKFSMVSHSGTIAAQLYRDAEHIGLTLGKTFSIGNEANIDLVDFLEYFKDDDETDVIGLYIEEIKRPKRFIRLAKEITPRKPIIAMYGGGSVAGNRAVRSHTGSMAGNKKIFDAMISETGIIQTYYIEDFLDIVSILSNPNFVYPKGNRIGILTHFGGPGSMVANNAERLGLTVPELSEEFQQKLRKDLPPTSNCSNPVDMTFDTDIMKFYLKFPKMLMKSGEIDTIIMFGVAGFYDDADKMQEIELSKHLEQREGFDDLLKDLEKIIITPTVKISQKYSVPIIYINNQTLASPWSKKVRKEGGIIFKFWDRPVKALVKICEYAEYRRRHS
jgi:acyl-CoA synthetase (NDP forming)